MCKHKLNKRKVNQTADLPDPELIQIWDYRTGDYNDVYSSIDVRGTYSQLKDMCKSAMGRLLTYSEIFEESESIDILHTNEWGDSDLHVCAISQGTDKTDLRSWTSFIDLVKEQN
jgi:hypothetical protein